MKNFLRYTALTLFVFAIAFASPSARAAVGDYCQAAGGVPGHINSSNQCIPDDIPAGQSCGTNSYYNSKHDCITCATNFSFNKGQDACVSNDWGNFCTDPNLHVRGKINAQGLCIPESTAPGTECVLESGASAHLDKNSRCVADTACTGKSVGQLCDASGKIGHCDQNLACIADATKGSGDCVGKSVGQLCDASGQIGHCDNNLSCVADANQGAGQGASENPTPGSQPQGSKENPTTGENVTLINPLGPLNCSGSTCLMSFIQTLLSFIVRVGSVVIIVALVYVGYQFVAAQGNPTKLNTAKQALQWTIIGGLVLLGSQAIASAIQATIEAISIGS